MAPSRAARPADRTLVSTVRTTHFHRNLVCYGRAGFEVFSERTLSPPDGERYTIWPMGAARDTP